LRKEPRDRPQSIREIELLLDEIQTRLPDSEPAPLPWWRRLRERRVWAPAVAMLVATVAMLLLVRSLGRSPPLGTALSSSTSARTASARKKVQMTFQSTPSGVTVFREGDPRPLGVTPFAAEFEASSRSEVFEFRLEGWKVGRKHLALLASGPVELALTPIEGDPGTADNRPAGKRPQAAEASLGNENDNGSESPVRTKVKSKRREAAKRAAKYDQDAVMNPFE
jgi:hypothetical protein